MRELRGWRLSTDKGVVRACGTEYDDVNSRVGCFIITLPVASVNFDGEALVIKTESDDEFLLQFKFVSVAYVIDVQTALTQLGCENIPEEILKKYIVSVPEDLQSGYLWLFMCGSSLVLQACYKNESRERIPLSVSYHSSFFGHDSVLIGDDDIDFRYFEYTGYIEPYVWTENIRGIIIYNQGEDFEVRGVSSVLCAREASIEIPFSLFGG